MQIFERSHSSEDLKKNYNLHEVFQRKFMQMFERSHSSEDLKKDFGPGISMVHIMDKRQKNGSHLFFINIFSFKNTFKTF